MRARRRRAAVVLGLVLAAGPVRARGDDGAGEGAAVAGDDGLTWHGGDRCGSVTALRARIELHLGRALVADDAIAAVVDVVRAPIEGDVRATLRIVTRRGAAEREVHGANCAAVVDAVAFVLASAVTEDGEVPPITPTVIADANVPWIVRPVPVPRSLTGPAPPRVVVQLAADGWTDAGTLPQLRLGAGGSLAVSYRRLRVEVGAAQWDETWAPLSDETRTSGIALEHISGRGCGGVWRLWLCGGVLMGSMHVVGAPSVMEKSWIAATFQTRWQRDVVGPVGVAASIEGVANLQRPTFPDGFISHRPAVFAVRLGFSAVVTVW